MMNVDYTIIAFRWDQSIDISASLDSIEIEHEVQVRYGILQSRYIYGFYVN